ncbi:MAG: hypothetical protein V3575_04575 [Candidatus Absconditabacteria bacterium]
MGLDQYKDKNFQTNTYETQDSKGVRDIYDELKKQEKLALDEETQNSLKEMKIDLSLELAYVLEYGNGYLVEKGDTISHINALLPEGFSISVPDPRKLQSGKQIRVIVEKGVVYVKKIITKDKREIEVKEEVTGSKIVWGKDGQSKATYETYRLSRWAKDCEMQLDEKNGNFIAEGGQLIIPIGEVKSLEDLRAKTYEYRENKADEKALSFVSQLQDFDYNKDTNEFYSKDGKIVIPREQVKDFQELKDLIAIKVEELLNNQAKDFANRALVMYKEEEKQYFITGLNVSIPRDNIKSLDDLVNLVNIETNRYLDNQANEFALKLGIDFDEAKKAYIIPNMNATIVRDEVKSFEELKLKYDEITSRQEKPKLQTFEYSVKSGDGLIKIIMNNWDKLGLDSSSRKDVLDYYNNYKQEIVDSNSLRVSKNGDPIILLNSTIILPVHGVEKSTKQESKSSDIKIQEQTIQEQYIEVKKEPEKQETVIPQVQIDKSQLNETQSSKNESKETLQDEKTPVLEIQTNACEIDVQESPAITNQNQSQESEVVPERVEELVSSGIEDRDNETLENEEKPSIFDITNYGIFKSIKKYTIKQNQLLDGNDSIIIGHEDASIRNKDKPKLIQPQEHEVLVPPRIDISQEQSNVPKSSVKAILKRADMTQQEIQLEKVYSMRNLKYGYSLNQFHPETVTKKINESVYMLTLDGANVDQYLDKDGNMMINISQLVEHNQFDYSALTAGYVMFKIDGKVTLYKIKEITKDNDIIIGEKIEYFSESEYEAYRDIDMYHRFISKYDSSVYRGSIDKVWLDEMIEQDLLNVKFLFDLYMKSTLRGQLFEEYLRKVVDILPDQIITGKLNLSGEYFSQSNLRELSRFGYNTKRQDMEVISFDKIKTGDYYRSRGIIPLCEPFILEHTLSILGKVKNHKGAITEYKGDIKLLSSEITFYMSKKEIVLDANFETTLNEFLLSLKSLAIDDSLSLSLISGMIDGNLKPVDQDEQKKLNESTGNKNFANEKDLIDSFKDIGLSEFSVNSVLSFANQFAKNEQQAQIFFMKIYSQSIKNK